MIVNDSGVPVRSVEEGGLIPVIHGVGTTSLSHRLLPITEIQDGLTPSETAVQPEDLGEVAHTISSLYQSAQEALAEFDDINARIDALELVYGVD